MNRWMNWLVWIVVFSFQMETANAADPVPLADPGLVTVSSDYLDEAEPSRTITVRGFGFLVQVNTRTFVFTASHVSQGKNLKIHTGEGTELTFLGRLYDGKRDFEVLEVDTSRVTLLPTIRYAQNQFLYTPPASLSPRKRIVDRHNFILLNPGVSDPELARDNAFAAARTGVLHCDFYCRLLSGETLVQPGTSGSPLIAYVPTPSEWNEPALPFELAESVLYAPIGSYALRGMAIRRDRFFARSSFVPVASLREVLTNYLQGARTEKTPEAAWKLAGKLIFRRLLNGTQEAQVVSGSSGNGSTMDGGDWAELREDSPREVLSQMTAFPSNPEGSQQKETFFWLFMQRDPVTGVLISTPIWFDMEHFLPLRSFTFGLIMDKPPGTSFAFQRVGGKNEPVTLVSADGRSTLRVTPQTLSSRTSLADGATLAIDLNADGAVCVASVCEAKFLPITEVTASNGQIYLVDLRSLFTLNPAVSSYPAFRDPKNRDLNDQDWGLLMQQVLREDMATLRLFYRKKRPTSQPNAPLTIEEGRAVGIEWRAPPSRWSPS